MNKIFVIRIWMLFIFFILLSSVTALSFENNKDYNYLEMQTSSEECFGFIIEVSSNQSDNIQTNISRLINELLRNNIEVFWNINEISILTQDLLNDISQKIRFFSAVVNDEVDAK